jgi:hypothetical protein
LPPGVRNWGWKIKCLPYTSEYIKIITFNKNSYRGVFEGAKHDSEAIITKKSGLNNVKVYVCPEKPTHFYKRQKAGIWQTYRRTTQTKGKNLKPGKFCSRGSEMGMENDMFLNIQAPMARGETQFTKNLCNYDEDA